MKAGGVLQGPGHPGGLLEHQEGHVLRHRQVDGAQHPGLLADQRLLRALDGVAQAVVEVERCRGRLVGAAFGHSDRIPECPLCGIFGL